VVALEARKAADTRHTTKTITAAATDQLPWTTPPVESLTARRLTRPPTDTRPMPSVEAYDSLLHRRQTPH
jgi:hypothetical protein